MIKWINKINIESLPKESSINFLKNTFGVTEHKAKRATQIQNENGIFSTPNPKLGRRLPEATIVKGQEFYESDEVSRQIQAGRILLACCSMGTSSMARND